MTTWLRPPRRVPGARMRGVACGREAPRGDAAGCAEAIRRVFRDPELAARLGAAGRERAVERYQLGRTVEEYFGLYSRLAGR